MLKNKKQLIINYAILCMFIVAIMFTVIINIVEKREQSINKHRAAHYIVEDRFGKEIDFYTYAGEGTVISFWASWCTACVNELPLLNEAYKLNPFNFATINMGDNISTVNKYVDRYDLAFPIFLDSQQKAKQQFTVHTLPYTIVLNSQGEKIESYQGELSSIEDINRLSKLLNE